MQRKEKTTSKRKSNSMGKSKEKIESKKSMAESKKGKVASKKNMAESKKAVTESKKGMNSSRESAIHNEYALRSETESARNNLAMETLRGASRQASAGRTLGSATKDNRHGLHTDHTTTRRTESRRQGYMGSESKSKGNRKNI